MADEMHAKGVLRQHVQRSCRRFGAKRLVRVGIWQIPRRAALSVPCQTIGDVQMGPELLFEWPERAELPVSVSHSSSSSALEYNFLMVIDYGCLLSNSDAFLERAARGEGVAYWIGTRLKKLACPDLEIVREFVSQNLWNRWIEDFLSKRWKIVQTFNGDFRGSICQSHLISSMDSWGVIEGIVGTVTTAELFVLEISSPTIKPFFNLAFAVVIWSNCNNNYRYPRWTWIIN